MEKGDISNQITARLYVVFEGLLGVQNDPKAYGIETKAIKRGKYKQAVKTWEINQAMALAVHDAQWRKGYQVDILTWHDDEFAEALDWYLAQEQVMVGQIIATTPERLARNLARMPWVAAIYDPDPTHQFTYGSKGVIIDPRAPVMF
jgi:hypothetical protein